MVESQAKETSQNISTPVSGAEVVLLLLLVIFGIGLCVWVDRAFSWAYPEPTEQQFLGIPAITEKQDELTRLENLKKEAETQFVAAEMDRLKHTATIQSLEAVHPQIGKPPQESSTSISAEAQKTYETAKNQRIVAEQLSALLNSKIAQLKSAAKAVSETLRPEKEASTKAFQYAKTKYLLKKLAVAFLVPFVIVLLGLVVTRFLLRRFVQRPVWTNQGAIAYFVVAGSLLVMLGYQTLEVAGAVFMAMMLFVIILWKINWSKRVGRSAIENADGDAKVK